ncbi:ParA family protein [Trinickia mobilis]|uniref:ParA family protein n=1 Tax=Trinickia mobilis TaxID=2816356 RepID=UPI001A901E8B|nr:ParA family protein [Trinickia mobilis]
MRIITVINQKGGVGKTSLVFNLAMCAVEQGARTAVIDLDTQGSASRALTGEFNIHREYEGGADALILSDDAVSPHKTSHGIDVFHGHDKLDGIDNVEGIEDIAFSTDMRQRLRQLPYDVIVIDTPPAIGLRHMAPLYWSDRVLIPLEPEIESVIGMQNVLDSLELVREDNPGVVWMAAINKLKVSSRSHKMILESVRSSYGDQLIAELGDRVAVADSRQQEMPVPVWRYRGADKKLRDLWLNFCKAVVC